MPFENSTDPAMNHSLAVEILADFFGKARLCLESLTAIDFLHMDIENLVEILTLEEKRDLTEAIDRFCESKTLRVCEAYRKKITDIYDEVGAIARANRYFLGQSSIESALNRQS